jgi:hypothetical protein
MPKRKDFETSLPRETEPSEHLSTPETHSFNNILRHAQAFSASSIDAPESSSNKRHFSKEWKEPTSSMQSLRMSAQYLWETGPFSPEVREKCIAVLKRPEVQAKRIAALKRPEVKEKHSATIKATMNRPEIKEKHSATIKATMNRPEVKEKHKAATKAAMNRPEVKEKRIAAIKAAMNRPEVQAKRKETLQKKRKASLTKQKLEGTGRSSQKESHKPDGFEITWLSSPGEGITQWVTPEN